MQRSALTSRPSSRLGLGGLNGRGGAGGDGEGNFAHLVNPLAVDHRGLAVDAQDGDVGAVHGAAHVEAAGQRDADLGGHRHGAEILEQAPSMTAFTTPEASMAGVWQCTHPWVWTMLVIPAPVPPTGNL